MCYEVSVNGLTDCTMTMSFPLSKLHEWCLDISNDFKPEVLGHDIFCIDVEGTVHTKKILLIFYC